MNVYHKNLNICAPIKIYLPREDSLDVHERCFQKLDKLQAKFDALDDEHSRLWCVIFLLAKYMLLK